MSYYYDQAMEYLKDIEPDVEHTDDQIIKQAFELANFEYEHSLVDLRRTQAVMNAYREVLDCANTNWKKAKKAYENAESRSKSRAVERNSLEWLMKNQKEPEGPPVVPSEHHSEDPNKVG